MFNRHQEPMEKNADPVVKARSRGLRLLSIAAFAVIAAACSSPEQRIEKYYASGMDYLEEGDLGRANVQFQNALKIDEAHVPSLLGVAKIVEERKDFKTMFGIYQRIVRLDPDNVFAQVQLAKLYFLGSDETAALEHLEKALAIDPESADALSLKAGILLRVGDSNQAIEIAQGIIDKNPTNPEATAVLASARVKAGDTEGGIAELDRALAIDPKVPVLQILRIRLLENLGRSDEVLASYARLVEFFPEEAAYRRAYSGAFLRRGDYRQAIEQLEAVVDLEPGNDDAKLDVVRVVRIADGVDAAERKLRNYSEADPKNTNLQFALAEYYQNYEEWVKAIAVLNQLALSKDRNTGLRAKNLIATARINMGEPQQAKTLLEEILAEDPNNTEALLKNAGFQIEAEEYDAAVANLRAVLNDDPESAEAMLLMASAFERQEDYDVARAEYAKAFEASNKNRRVGNIYAKFLLRRGDARRAEEILVQTLASDPDDLENLKLLAGARLAQQDWQGADEVAGLIEKYEQNSGDELVRNIKTAALSGMGDYDQLIDLLAPADGVAAPLEARPLSTLVGAYVQSGRNDEARTMLEGVLASEPDNYTAQILYAQVQMASDNNEAAVAALNKAVEIEPERPIAYELLYRYYLTADRDEDAASLIETALADHPDSYGLRFFKADILLREGDREGALAIYSDLIEERPADRIVANNFVSLSSELRLDQASIDRALEVTKVLEDVVNPNIQDTVGWAYYRAGDYDKALKYLSSAAAGNATDPETLYHLGVAQFAAGDQDNWRSTLTKALELGGENFRFESDIRSFLERE